MAEPKVNWSPWLRKWERRYRELFEDVILDLSERNWDELQPIREELDKVGQTNCSWFLYDVAKRLIGSALPADEQAVNWLRDNAVNIRQLRKVDSVLAGESR